MKKIKLWVNTGFAGCKHEEVTDCPEDWDSRTEEEQQDYLDMAASDYLFDRCECGADLLESEADK